MIAGAPRTSLLVLNNAILAVLAADKAAVANLAPCFAAFKAGCKRCGGGVRRSEGDYAAVRDCLGNLPSAKKKLLKSLLNADKVRFTVRRGNARVELTF